MPSTGKPLFQFVDERAAQWPDAPALRDERLHYSYAELSVLSSYFAYRLHEIGDVTGRHVGLLYDCSAQSIILLLAIMKAGGIYVPLNRALPKTRLDNMVREADIAYLVAPDQPSVVLDQPVTTFDPFEPSEVVAGRTLPAPTDVAYAIFTSGSTGLPKLALLNHDAVRHVMTHLVERYHITREDRVLQFANLSFDGSISEIFGAFIAGAELVVPDEHTKQSIPQLAAYFDNEGISIAVLPPSLLAHLPLTFQSLKTLVVAGEACPSALAQAITQQVPHFINAYGPTECSICVSTYEIPKDFKESVTPIGEPLPGVSILVLDEAGEPVADGSVGELYVGGPSLFNGYYNDSVKTSAALIERDVDGVWYKTGDYVSRSGDTLTYVSRADDYIKLHGLRISPLEIEEAIQRSNKAIRGVAVILDEVGDEAGLAAFYEGEHELPTDQIIHSIKQLLPAYAIPHKIIYLPSLPLTDNKKIDRRALAFMLPSYTIPTAPADTLLQELWQSILNVPVNDATDFFLAGGDSLKAMRLIAEIDRRQQLRLSLSALYDHPLFGDFAAYVEMLSPALPLQSYDPHTLTSYEVMLWSASAHSGNQAAYTLTEIITPTFTVVKAKLQQAVKTLSDNFTAASYRYVLGENGLEKRLDTGIAFVDHGRLTAEESARLAESLANSTIDLASETLITIHFALSDDQPFIVLHAHHIVLSASIVSLFIEKLWQYYIGDAVQQENRSAVRDYTEDDCAFWKQAYDSTTDYIQLPWNGIRQPRPRNNGATLVTTVDASVDRIVSTLGITKFVFYRSIFALLLHRLTGQNMFYIGSSVDVRDDDTLGAKPAMLNSLPIISSIKRELTFMEFALEAQRNVRAALNHSHVPLHDIMNLHPFEQDRLVGPFNVMFDYIEKPACYAVPGLGIVDSSQCFNATAKHDLTLTVAESQNIELQWEYDTDLLDERTVRQFSTIFSYLCHAVLDDAQAEIATIPLLDGAERAAMLKVGTGHTRSRLTASFYERFADMVATQPEAIAVRHSGGRTTYRDLSYLVEHFSAVLIEQELAQDTPVGVFMDRSPEMVAIIVALWRLGYAYVPIEITLPLQRISSILETTQMPLVMTKLAYRHKLLDSKVRLIDETYRPTAQHIPEVAITPSTLAYVIFTSGSTGTPKGVMIEHAGMMNHADGMIEYLELDSTSTIAQTASHSFDISVWQLTTPLIAGGTIAIYSKDEQGNLDTFTARLYDDRVTILELVPSYITILLEYLEDTGSQSRLGQVDALISTGENISWPIVEGWLRNMPNVRLMNAYGPAEASDDTNLFTFEDVAAIQHRGLPVGRALANVNVYVLDDTLNPQPIGVQGEIHIAGIAVGRGYINDPERTNKSFITNPHTGERMYRTGDLGYWSSEGQLIYLGRSDFQVKIRGFRIELEEIEAHIIRYPHITSVAVVVVDRNNAKQLHAYVTADIDIDSTVMISHLRDHLPDYMVPSSIVQLSALPLNNSGKIDRHFLANKERLRFKETEEAAAPSEAESAVMSVWREVFGLEYVTIDDDYYALGGDSITSFRVYAKLSAKGYHLTLQDILAYPVLKDFAGTLTKQGMTMQRAYHADQPVALTPIQSRLLQSSPNEVMAQNIYLEGAWNRVRLDTAIQTVLRKQGVLYLTFAADKQTFGSQPRFNGTYLFVASHIEVDTAFARLYAELNKNTLFVYGAEGDDTTVTTLYLSADHSIVDVVSWNILVAAIQDAYEGTVNDDVEIDYTFGAWGQALQDADDPSAEILAYWQSVLAPTVEATRLLEQRFIQEIPERQFYRASIPLPIMPRTEATAYLAVLQALTDMTGATHPGLLIEAHGRYGERYNVDLSQTVGWFTLLMPLAGTTNEEIDAILQLDSATKLAYGSAIQRGLLDYTAEPRVIVNYLGKSNMSGYAMRRGGQERPIGKEMMELSIYEDETRLHVELLLYATPTDIEFGSKLLTSITGQLAASAVGLKEDRLQAILQRIEGSNG